ncbi:Methyltransferase domain containing protein [Candidatus Methylopumilus universalis]|uniref:methyltransferase domain-containing protein n=1 Tax=Candidatus Methylopumilus universalis TaxID=2588536 RepID=UPI003BEED8FD
MLPKTTTYIEYACDLCGSDNPIEIPYSRIYSKGQPVHICGDCGFVYIKNRRSSEEIARVWTEEIYGEIYTAIKNPAVIARQTFVAEFLSSNLEIKNKKVFDIGAGEGFFLKYLKDNYGIDPMGVEPSKSNCQRLTELGISNYAGTVEQFVESKQGENYQADIVTIMWTLENCLSCIDMLNCASSLLPIGGKIIVATGSRILVPFKKPLFTYFSSNPTDSHCFRFSANSLQTALAKTGFKIIKTNHYLDNDILCVLAEKTADSNLLEIKKDKPLEVLSFFERWHQDSIYYMADWT